MAKPENIRNWHYTPLSASCIRIIQLLPAQDPNDPLECRLLETSLENAPEYIAVSYVWGDEANPSMILCKGAQLSVTRNLDAALRRFRDRSQHITLWVDSICINQQDTSELNNQVVMMGDIYRTASHVYIWLGSEEREDDSSAVMEYLKELVEKVAPRYDEINQWERTDIEFHEAFNLLKPDSPQFTAFSNLILKRPWYDRAWTFQESVLARTKTYFCGRFQIPHSQMVLVFSMMHMLQEKTRRAEYKVFQETRFETMIMGKIGDKELAPKNAGDLGYWLSRRRGAKCKIPSDLVYSNLGVASRLWTTLIQPDYQKPFNVVFAESITHIIQVHGNLNVIGLVDYASVLTPELPSWVPDWRIPGANDYLFHINIYCASGTSKPSIQLSDDAKQLALRGLTLDIISSRSPETKDPLSANWIEEQFGCKKYPDMMYRFTGEPIKDALIRTEWADETRQWKRFDANSLASLQMEIENFQRTHKGWDDYYEFFQFATALNSKGVIQMKLQPTVAVRGDRSLEFHNVTGSFLIRTEKGMLGRVPPTVKSGDIVIVPLGGQVPIVLRPCRDKFTLVGECYLHGFMDGEALVDARKTADTTYDDIDRSWLGRLHEEPIPFPTQEYLLM